MTAAKQFRPPAVPAVRLGGFWGRWQDVVCDATASILLDRCVDAGMLKAIDVRAPSPGVVIPIQPWGGTTQMFWDSDLAKSIETIAYTLARKPNPGLEARADAIIDMYERLQAADGYLNAWFQRVQPGRRWTNLRDHHELYCAGHLMEAAVAYFQATGKRKLLDIMCRCADHLITVFGHGDGQLPGYCGHPEVELALVKLARATGERKYLGLAKFFIDERGTEPHFFTREALRDNRAPENFIQKTYEYGQSHQPVRAQRRVVGHAVRAMYLYSGMADVATEYGDDSLTEALQALWADLTAKQIYVTGGIGPSASNEGFTGDYDLPNETAYAETCASVALVFWASRMLGRGPDRRYADVLERALYNGALTGLSLDGRSFFYDNPLESVGRHRRWNWHHCPCCPPNIARLVASIGSYFYGLADDEIAVHLYGESEATLPVAGHEVRLTQATDYPWSGDVRLDVGLARPLRFALALRIPEWAEGAVIRVGGKAIDAPVRNGYARIERDWQDGDTVDLALPMALRRQFAHPRVRADAGRVALMRGPLVYCAEEADNGADLNALVIPAALETAATQPLAALAGGVAVSLGAAREETAGWGEFLYRPHPAARHQTALQLVPYHLWANRGPGAMLVWMQAERAE